MSTLQASNERTRSGKLTSQEWLINRASPPDLVASTCHDDGTKHLISFHTPFRNCMTRKPVKAACKPRYTNARSFRTLQLIPCANTRNQVRAFFQHEQSVRWQVKCPEMATEDGWHYWANRHNGGQLLDPSCNSNLYTPPAHIQSIELDRFRVSVHPKNHERLPQSQRLKHRNIIFASFLLLSCCDQPNYHPADEYYFTKKTPSSATR